MLNFPMASSVFAVSSSALQYTCKCFFNHSAAHRNVPGSLIPATPIINSYYSVVRLQTGLRLEATMNGSNCPSNMDPNHFTAYDTASTTDYFCACPDPNTASAASGSLLEVPLIGVIVSLLGAVLTSLGQVLMKWAHTHNELRPLKDRRQYYANPLWYVGLITYAASQILCVVAFASVTQGENAVIGTFSLASNAIFAQYFLGEAMQKLHYVGIFFIMAGSTMVLLSTLGVRCINTPEAVEEIKRALSPSSNLPFFCFMMLIGIVVFTALAVRRLGECTKHLASSSAGRRIGGTTTISNTKSSTKSNSNKSSSQSLTESLLSSEDQHHPNAQKLQELNSTQSSTSSMFRKKIGETVVQYSDRAMLFVTISACMGCISSFCASVIVKLLTVEISSFGSSVAPWVVLGIFLIAICMSMHYLNRGLQSGQALLVVPGYFVGNTMLAMVCSLLYQKTYLYLTSLELVMFFVGFFTSIGGVIAMVWNEMSHDDDRTKAWMERLAKSPRMNEADMRAQRKKRGLPPRHSASSGGINPYERDLTFDNMVESEIRAPLYGSRSISPIDPNYRGPSPVLGSSNGSINSSNTSVGNSVRSGTWQPIAVSEDLVDSLSNQGNLSNIPYSHRMINEEDPENSCE